jgi:hypothetical protein
VGGPIKLVGAGPAFPVVQSVAPSPTILHFDAAEPEQAEQAAGVFGQDLDVDLSLGQAQFF